MNKSTNDRDGARLSRFISARVYVVRSEANDDADEDDVELDDDDDDAAAAAATGDEPWRR